VTGIDPWESAIDVCSLSRRLKVLEEISQCIQELLGGCEVLSAPRAQVFDTT
jgi:hypothetical protein